MQAWGEPRVTRNVDVSASIGIGEEADSIARLLKCFRERGADAAGFAILNRVLLCQSPDGVGIDIGLAGFPFEATMIERCVLSELVEGFQIPVVCAEDLITMKVFAGRPRDWFDVQSIISRQSGKLRWQLVDAILPELLDLIGRPDRLDQLLLLRA